MMNKAPILNEIDVYNAVPADKRKSKIAEIADRLDVPCWFVAETLKETGCSVDLHWYSQQKRFGLKNTAVATQEAAPGDKAYLAKVVKVQDKTIREQAEKIRALEAELEQFQCQEQIKVETAQMIVTLKNRDEEISRLNAELDGYRAAADDREKLLHIIEHREKQIAHYERTCEEKDVQVRRLQTKNEELELYTNAVDNENAKLHEQIDLLLHGAAALKNAAEEEPEVPRPTFEMVPAKEYHSCRAPGGELELADVLNDFCRSLSGVESYLCGRILEALYCWRYNKTADPLRVLGGLVSELLEMELDEQEDMKCEASGII